MKRLRATATTDAKTIPERLMLAKLIDKPDKPVMKITDVRIRLSAML